MSDRCDGCGQDQSALTDPYVTCGECGHRFTEESLVEMTLLRYQEMGLRPSEADSHAKSIIVCACCPHDL